MQVIKDKEIVDVFLEPLMEAKPLPIEEYAQLVSRNYSLKFGRSLDWEKMKDILEYLVEAKAIRGSVQSYDRSKLTGVEALGFGEGGSTRTGAKVLQGDQFSKFLHVQYPLHKNIFFIASIIFPLVIGVLSILVIIVAEYPLQLCGSSECFSNFYNLFKVPLSIAGLAVPVSAIMAAIHRSNETATQIKISSEQARRAVIQNSYVNLFRHKEEFIKELEQYEKGKKFKISDKSALYGNIYRVNNYGFFSPYAIAVNSDDLIFEATKLYDETVCSFNLEKPFTDAQAFNYYCNMARMFSRLNIKIRKSNSLKVYSPDYPEYFVTVPWDEEYKESRGLQIGRDFIKYLIQVTSYPHEFDDMYDYHERNEEMHFVRDYAKRFIS